ncbi:hypothetical protein PO124_31265 [Bacillus licheniformis]|nr:hypothetical protein [Bacillus licheniformis]
MSSSGSWWNAGIFIIGAWEMRDGIGYSEKRCFNEEIAAGQAACQLGGDHEYLTDARACLKQALLSGRFSFFRFLTR